ncbi:MAG: hypothetical protein CEN87_453 [Parcubacteria group bacterium Licking1014_1]|nr:MAG: hypothetical protein CEN87_453 [Parcubacteria group bacterium Licking1014_1]
MRTIKCRTWLWIIFGTVFVSAAFVFVPPIYKWIRQSTSDPTKPAVDVEVLSEFLQSPCPKTRLDVINYIQEKKDEKVADAAKKALVEVKAVQELVKTLVTIVVTSAFFYCNKVIVFYLRTRRTPPNGTNIPTRYRTKQQLLLNYLLPLFLPRQ